MKIKKQSVSVKPEALKLPATPKALKNKGVKNAPAVPAKATKAEKKQKAPKVEGVRWTTNGGKNEVCEAHIYGARGNDLILGDGIPAGVILQGLKRGHGLVMKAMPHIGLGPNVSIVKFKANGKSRSAKDGKTYPVMRDPKAFEPYIVVQQPGGKLTWGCERAKEREETRYAKVS